MAFDTIIKGGNVVDGSGLPMRRADVGIKDGMITDIGRLSGAKKTIDADGLYVMPGIIDAHTHYDPQLSFEPFATSSCFHGVTSVVTGNCGYSIAPCRPNDHEGRFPVVPHVPEPSPKDPIGRCEPRPPSSRTSEHVQLLTQRNILEANFNRRSEQRHYGTDNHGHPLQGNNEL